MNKALFFSSVIFILSVSGFSSSYAEQPRAAHSSKRGAVFRRTARIFCIPTLLVIAAAALESPRAYYRIEKKARVKTGDGEPKLHFGKLSYNWGPEYIGLDLRYSDEQKMTEVPSVDIGIVDLNFNFDLIPSESFAKDAVRGLAADPTLNPNHGTGVANLSTTWTKTGKLKVVVPIRLRAPDHSVESGLVYLQDPDLKLVHFSLSMFGSRGPQLLVRRLAAENKIVVIGAGNKDLIRTPYEWYLSREPVWQLKHDEDLRNMNEVVKLPAIIVGSLAPNGEITAESSDAPGITLFAPGDRYLQTTTVDRNKSGEVLFTSGAAALVTDALTSPLAWLPDIELRELRELLKRTNLQTEAGLEIINAYKLNAVAVRLLQEKGWRSNLHSRLIQDASTYDFTTEAQQEFDRGRILILSSDPVQRKEGLNYLRRSFFLKQTAKTKALISAIKARMGLTDESDFYKTLRVDNERILGQ